MDTPATPPAVEDQEPQGQEPEPLMSRQQYRAKLRELQDEVERLNAKLSASVAKRDELDAAGRAMGAEWRTMREKLQRSEQIKSVMCQDFTTAIRTAWPRLTDAEKAPLLEFWKRLGHKDQPGPMSGLVLVGG